MSATKRRKMIEEEEEKEESGGGDLPCLFRCRRGDPDGWQNLNLDLLQLIFNRISSSIPDLLSFSLVCTSWRSVAKSLFSSISPPPLLLSSFCDVVVPKRSYMSRLKTITSTNLDPTRTYRSPISRISLNRNCCGCSYGHLIFSGTSTVLVSDIFSSTEFRFPKPQLPPGFLRCFITHGVLTAPPSSSSSSRCMLLLIGSGHVFSRSLSPNPHEDWSVLTSFHVQSIVVFNGKLHALHDNGSIFALEFVPNMHWNRLPDPPNKHSVGVLYSYMRLADCNGELLLVCFMKSNDLYTSIIEVYRMELDHLSGGAVWVRVKDIGDWCLFMDFVGHCPLACRNPGKWGGQSNCVYFAGPKFKRWSVLPLDGTKFVHELQFLPTDFDQWPKPTWLYPSWTLISQHVTEKHRCVQDEDV